MLEMGIAQAQTNFTKILDEQTLILDKKNKTKRAVILPYAMYARLVKQAHENDGAMTGSFSSFRGMLSQDFGSDDDRYNRIVNEGQ